MASTPQQISALLQLIDDPDEEVYGTVSEELLHYGRAVIPRLEQLWEATEDEDVQERIETLIHRVHFTDLQEEFMEWARSPAPEILRGAILVARYQFPDLNVAAVINQFDKIRRNIWLELSPYMSPLEQINVFNSILYSYCKLQGAELTEREPKHFFINQVLDSKQGNVYSLGVLYLALAELLDVPIFAVDVPRQFVFAYIDTLRSFMAVDEDDVVQQIQFYIDPTNGSVYTQKDVDTYLRKINALDRDLYFVPMTAKRVIWKMLEELALCYRYRREEAKAEEIEQLMRVIVDDFGL
jgi:hypothetical protein